MFTHEKFEAYQIAIEFSQLSLKIMDEIPIGHSSIKDQLKRATFSIPLNIAEGTGKNTKADRKRYYAIARGSAMECAAICDIVALIDENLNRNTLVAKEKLVHIVKILSTICSQV